MPFLELRPLSARSTFLPSTKNLAPHKDKANVEVKRQLSPQAFGAGQAQVFAHDPTNTPKKRIGIDQPTPLLMNDVKPFRPVPIRQCAIPVGFSADIPIDGKKKVTLFGRDVLLVRNSFGELSAVQNDCPHLGASLAQGAQEGARITCRYHLSSYHVGTGACVSHDGPALETFDVSEVNGIIFAGPRGLTGADTTEIPFLHELAHPENFAPEVRRDSVIEGHYSLMFENIIDVQHLVGVHNMPLTARNVRTIARNTIEFEQPLAPSRTNRMLFGDDEHLICTIKSRPPFASFVELRRPNSHLEGRGQRLQIFMHAVPTNDTDRCRLLTVYRQSIVHFKKVTHVKAAGAKLPLPAALRDLLDWVASSVFVAHAVDKAIEEDGEVIAAQKYFTATQRRARTIIGMKRAKIVERNANVPALRKVILFGATGGTGKIALNNLLDAGHEVTVFVRRPGAIKLQHNNLRIEYGDVLNETQVEEAMRGQQAAMVVLGVTKNSPTDLCSRGTDVIVRAMQQHKVGRLVCVSSYGAGSNDKLPWAAKMAMGAQLTDKVKQEEIIVGSGLDYTILRPLHLVDSKKSMAHAYAEGSTDEPAGNSVSRRAVARFAAAALNDTKTVGQIFALSQK